VTRAPPREGRGSVPCRNGAPRPMKMGTIVSPWRYDAMADYALQPANLRRPAILRWRHGRPSSQFRSGGPVTFDSGPFDQSRDRRDVPTADSCLRRDPSVAETPLTLTLPIEGANNSLTGKNCAGLFGCSNGELVSFQLEEPDLGRTGQKLVPR